MKYTFLVNGTTFTVSAKCITEGVYFPWDKKKEMLHNKFRVTVKTDKGRTSFDFYGSYQDYTNGVTELDEAAAKHALYCFVSDACSGKNSFEDFCSELGYDEDSRTAERTYKACVKSLEKFERLTDADIYETVNELND